MWEPLLRPGLAVVSGTRGHLRIFFQEVAHTALRQAGAPAVLWCDGDHGFDPYRFAEANLAAGRSAEDGADRMLVKRCMTPFQWDSVLNVHLQEKLVATETGLVVVQPFDRLFSTDELSDWEQEDHTRFTLRRLRDTARRHRIPILLGIDMERWWRTHPTLAQATLQTVPVRWQVTYPAGRWHLASDEQTVMAPGLRHQSTLQDFLPRQTPLAPLRQRITHG